MPEKMWAWANRNSKPICCLLIVKISIQNATKWFFPVPSSACHRCVRSFTVIGPPRRVRKKPKVELCWPSLIGPRLRMRSWNFPVPSNLSVVLCYHAGQAVIPMAYILYSNLSQCNVMTRVFPHSHAMLMCLFPCFFVEQHITGSWINRDFMQNITVIEE